MKKKFGDEMQENYFAIGIINIIALLILEMTIRNHGSIGGSRRTNYIQAILMTQAMILFEMAASVMERDTIRMVWLDRIINILGFTVSAVIPMFLANVFGEVRTRLKGWVWAPAVMNGILCLLSVPFSFIFQITAGGKYQRGTMFYLYVITYVWYYLILLYKSLQTANRYPGKNKSGLKMMTGLLLLGTALEIVIPKIHTTWSAVTLCLILYYAFLCEMNNQLDALTGIYNRTAYESELSKLAKAETATIIVLDVDEFKTINDRYGHQTGDQCLARLGEILKRVYGSYGNCFRIGGDEFCVLCHGNKGPVLRRLEQSLNREIIQIRRKNGEFPWISYGSAVYCKKEDMEIGTAISRADKSLYGFKRAKKLEEGSMKHEQPL